MKNFIWALVFVSPPFLKKQLLRWFSRAQFGRKSRIGWFSSISGRSIKLGDYSTIKPLTLIRCDGDVSIGDYSEISSFSVIYGCASFRIGNKCYIGPQTWINTSEDVIAGNGVGIGPRSIIFTHGSFLPYTEGYPVRFGKVIIGDSVWIPADVFVSPGIEIGDNVLINSRSVLTKSLPPGQYVAGFPAKPIRPIEEVRKEVTPADRDRLISDVLKHFIYFLQQADRGIEVIEQGEDVYTLRSHRRNHLLALVNSEGFARVDFSKLRRTHPIFIINRPDWAPPQPLPNKQLNFDFTTMKTDYSKDHVHGELYKFLKMYYGIIFEYLHP